MCHEDQRRDDLVVIDELLGYSQVVGRGRGSALDRATTGAERITQDGMAASHQDQSRRCPFRLRGAAQPCKLRWRHDEDHPGGDDHHDLVRSWQGGEAADGSRLRRLSRDHRTHYQGNARQVPPRPKAFTRDAVAFLAPSPPTPPDVYFLNARTTFVDFEAHRCGLTYLRRALSRRLTATQRRRVVGHFTFLGEIGRELTRRLRGNEAQPGG
jgi:hypothetical protein